MPFCVSRRVACRSLKRCRAALPRCRFACKGNASCRHAKAKPHLFCGRAAIIARMKACGMARGHRRLALWRCARGAASARCLTCIVGRCALSGATAGVSLVWLSTWFYRLCIWGWRILTPRACREVAGGTPLAARLKLAMPLPPRVAKAAKAYVKAQFPSGIMGAGSEMRR